MKLRWNAVCLLLKLPTTYLAEISAKHAAQPTASLKPKTPAKRDRDVYKDKAKVVTTGS